jgi:hypothetical protein
MVVLTCINIVQIRSLFSFSFFSYQILSVIFLRFSFTIAGAKEVDEQDDMFIIVAPQNAVGNCIIDVRNLRASKTYWRLPLYNVL